MTVYVDDMKAPFGRMVMCHMIANTDDELLSMADMIGVRRKWIQHVGTAKVHFDVSMASRARALRAGAVEITRRQCSYMCMRRRVTGELGTPEDAERWAREYAAQRDRLSPAPSSACPA